MYICGRVPLKGGGRSHNIGVPYPLKGYGTRYETRYGTRYETTHTT